MRERERARSNISQLTNVLALTHADHVVKEPSTYVLLLIILTYMLLIMSRTSSPQAYSLLAIYVSTELPRRSLSVSDGCFVLL